MNDLTQLKKDIAISYDVSRWSKIAIIRDVEFTIIRRHHIYTISCGNLPKITFRPVYEFGLKSGVYYVYDGVLYSTNEIVYALYIASFDLRLLAEKQGRIK